MIWERDYSKELAECRRERREAALWELDSAVLSVPAAVQIPPDFFHDFRISAQVALQAPFWREMTEKKLGV
jgi:hypothetical protein